MVPVVLTATASLGGCTGSVNEPIAVADIESGGEDWIGEKLEVRTSSGLYHIYVTEVSYPWLIGFDYKSGYEPPLKIDLREVIRVERYSATETTGRAMAWVILPITIGVLALVLLAWHSDWQGF